MKDHELGDDRVTAMQTNIRAAVDADVLRRARRTRLLAAVAAGAVVIALGGVGFNLATGLGGPGQGISASEMTGDSLAPGSGGDSSADGPAPGLAQQKREVITTARLSIVVTEPEAAARKISKLTESLGGRVDQRSQSTEGRKQIRTATLVIGVPRAEVTGMLDRLDAYGEVEDLSVQTEDVTTQGQDLDARIEALRISVGRLQTIMRKANSSKELIGAENALSQRQANLDSLVAQRRALSNQVDLSTLTIDLRANDEAQPVKVDGFKGGLVTGWNALASTLAGAMVLFGVLLPWLALLAGVAVIYATVRRLRRR